MSARFRSHEGVTQELFDLCVRSFVYGCLHFLVQLEVWASLQWKSCKQQWKTPDRRAENLFQPSPKDSSMGIGKFGIDFLVIFTESIDKQLTQYGLHIQDKTPEC